MLSRIVAIVCAVAMTVSLMPLPAFAAEELPEAAEQIEEQIPAEELPVVQNDAAEEIAMPDQAAEEATEDASTPEPEPAAMPIPEKGPLSEPKAGTMPLTLVGSSIPVTAMTHLADGKQAVYVSFKVKNNSSETLEDVTLVESPEFTATDRYGTEYEWTPYSVNNFKYDSSGAHEVENAEENYFGYDIAPGQTATFWLVVRTDSLAAGSYTHKIKLGRKEERWWTDDEGYTNREIYVAETYTDDITVDLLTYNAPVKISVGKFVFPFSVTQQNVLDLGAYDLSSYNAYDLYNDIANYTIGIKNVSTANDPYAGTVPNAVFFYHLEYEGSPYNQSPVSNASLWDDSYLHTVGPDAIQEIGLRVKPEDWVEGTYTGNLVISPSPAKITVNGGSVACDESLALVKVPFKVTFTGRNPNLPDAPAGLIATAGNGRVELSWNVPMTADGEPYTSDYCVYRREGTETETDWKKIDWTKYEELYTNPTEPFFVDDTAENGKTYSYVVFAGGSPRHGYPSNAATATPSESAGAVKLSAPIFSAYPEMESVELTWHLPENSIYNPMHGSGEGVIDHFNIYRNGKLYAQVDRSAVIDNSHWDSNVFTGETYYVYDFDWVYNVSVEPQVVYAWQIAAVDMNGNEGYLCTAQDVAAKTRIPVLDSHNVGWYSDYTFDDNGYNGLYFDPALTGREGSGLKLGVWSSTEYGSSITTLKITRREGDNGEETVLAEATPMNYVNGGTEYDWIDGTVQKGKTYTYTVTGSVGAREKTNSYSFAVKIPANNSEELLSYDGPSVTYSLKESGTTPTLQIWREAGSSYKIYRNGTLVKSYSQTSGSAEVTWADTPAEDGTYVYQVERITNGVAVPGSAYTFVKDTSPTDESTLPQKPGAPALTARLCEGTVVFSIVPSAEGGEADGYYLYRTGNGEYNEWQWTYGDGTRGEDYPWYAAGRYTRLSPDKTSYNDTNVNWSGYDGWDEASQQSIYTQKEHKWWIVAYNEVGVSAPSQIVTYADAPVADGEGYEAPKNGDTEAPGKPAITNAWMSFEDNVYPYDTTFDPTRGNLNAYLNYTWTESLTGGGADRFNIEYITPDGYTGHGVAYLYNGMSHKDGVTLPYDTGDHTIRVSAVNEIGESEYDEVTIRTYGIPRFRVKDAAAGTVEVRFTAPEDDNAVVTAYRIDRRSQYGLWGMVDTVAPSSLTTADGQDGQFYIYTDNSAKEGGTYFYRVTAVCADGIDRTSAEREITSQGTASALTAPSGLQATIRDGGIFLEWQAPAEGNVDHYECCMTEDGESEGFTFELTDSDATSAVYPNGYWSEGQTQTLKVRAVNSAGEGPWSEEITIAITGSALHGMTQEAPPKRISLQATPGDGQITLNWYRVPLERDEYGVTSGEAMYYILQKTRMPDGLDEEQDSSEIMIKADPQKNPSVPYEYIDTDVENGRVYRYQIVPTNSAGSMYPEYYSYATPNGPSAADLAAEEIAALAEGIPDPENVTIDDEESLAVIEEIYNSLPDDVKAALPDEVREKIEGAIAAIQELKEREQYADLIAPVQALIDALPDPSAITLDDEAQVAAAREALMRLEPAVRKYVSALRLTAAEMALAALHKEQEDRAAAAAVEALIAQIPSPSEEITLEDGPVIEAAKAAYDALTDDQKEYLTESSELRLSAAVAALNELRKADLADAQVTAPDMPYTGYAVLPDLTVTVVRDGQTLALAYGTDYYLGDIENNVEVGEAQVTLYGMGDNCKGSKVVSFRIIPADLAGANGGPAAVIGAIPDQIFSGEAIEPAVIVTRTVDGKLVTLQEGADYTVSYENNTAIGTAEVIVTGMGNYTGSVVKTFRINHKPGWEQADGYWYFYNEDGTMATSVWKKDSKGWCWLQEDGRMLTNGWAKDSKGWCWIGPNGYMVEKTQWIKVDGGWYHITNGYRDQSKWMKDSKGWCYLGRDGRMVTNGWAKDSKGWCWMGSDGYWVSNKWVKDGGEWYYIKSNHYMASNEWAKDSGGWMYMNASGKITKSKWVKDGGYWYYLKANGYMATGTQTIGGKTYRFDSSGRWID